MGFRESIIRVIIIIIIEDRMHSVSIFHVRYRTSLNLFGFDIKRSKSKVPYRNQMASLFEIVYVRIERHSI